MIYILSLTLIGCLIGTITGLTPGLHVNTVCLIGLGLYPALGISLTDFGVVMIATAVTQTFIDFIPAIFIGVPEEDTALSVLPAHRLVLQGKAMEAVEITAYGSLLGVVYSLIFLVPFLYIIPIVHKEIKNVVIYIVLVAVIVLILREKNKKIAVISFMLSGYLGLVSLNLKVISSSEALFPLFTGLFGFSNILLSLKEKSTNITQGKKTSVKLDRTIAFGGLVGSVCGIMVGLLPGMSPSQVGIIAYDFLGSNLRSFLVSVSAINTSDAIYSLVSLYAIDNPRSGVAAMLGQVMEVDFKTLMLFIGVTGVSALIATIIYLFLGRTAMKFVTKVNYTKLNLLVMFFILALVYLTTGWFGIFLAALSTTIGVIPIMAGASRTHLMGLLILPTLLYYFQAPILL